MTNEERKEVHHYYSSCCAPWMGRARWGGIFCGVALIILGVAWLAANLGWITAAWWQIALPLLIVVWGLGVLLSGRRRGGREPREPSR